mgnify:CR=1 FL=1
MEAYTSSDVRAALRRLDRRLHRITSGDMRRFLARSGGRPLSHTQMQAVFNLRYPQGPERSLHEVIVTHGVAAEKLGPGGFERYLQLLHQILEGHSVPTSEVTPRHPTLSDVQALVDRYGSQAGPRAAAMLKEAVRLAGFGGRIIVEKTTSPVPSVELVRGYGFDMQQLLPVDFSFTGPRVACIDGHVESVSEVHHLLEAAAAAREPAILFLRGASDDVKHTLKVNYDRGSLRVVPIGARFDLEGMNTLVDLATVTGCDLVSSLKGDLISGIDYASLPRVEQVTMFKGRVVVVTNKARPEVAALTADLKRRRSEEPSDEKGALLDRRIRSLSPNHVVVRLPDDKDFVVNSQAMDYALRAVRAAVDRGVDASGAPAVTELAARHYAARCAASLLSVGACLA